MAEKEPIVYYHSYTGWMSKEFDNWSDSRAYRRQLPTDRLLSNMNKMKAFQSETYVVIVP